MPHDSPDADRPAALPTDAPATVVDYLVARRGPPRPSGLAYDYVLGGDGLFVAAAAPLLRVRVPVASCTVRGLPPLYAACMLPHGRVPLVLWEEIVAAALEAQARGREVLLAVRHAPGAGYRLVRPAQLGGPDLVVYRRQADTLLELHSHGPLPARFSPRDDADEQRLGLYGVVGRLGARRPEVRLRAGAYGHFLPLPWEAVFAGGAADRAPFRDTNTEPPDPPEIAHPAGPPEPRLAWAGEAGGTAAAAWAERRAPDEDDPDGLPD
jgi:hypothetical protein